MSKRKTNAVLAENHPTEAPGAGGLPENNHPHPKRESAVLADREVLYARRPPLTREEELTLAEAIERNSRALLEAIARSPVALEELRAMVEEFRDGGPEAIDLTPAAAEDGSGREALALEFLDAIERVRKVARRADARQRAEAHFIETLLQHGLSHPAIDRILGKLALFRQARRGASRRTLEATFSAIDESHRAAERAKAILVEANIGLVMMTASKRTQAGLALRDLVQEGCMGLMRAVEKFDHRRGVRFSTYAMWWIRHAVNRALSDQSRTIRVPVHLLEARFKAVRGAQEFVQQRGREPTEAELSELTGLPLEKVRTVYSVPKEPVSMDAPVGSEQEARIGDFVADPDAASSVDAISATHVARRLRALLTTLPYREAEVLRLRFGIDRPETLTLQEIGQRFSVSRERIRQIEAEALAALRGRAEAEELDSHLAG